MLRLLAHDVDDVVDRDATEQPAVAGDDGRRKEVARLEQAGDLGDRHLRRDRRDLRIHFGADDVLRIHGQEPRQRQCAEVAVVPVDDEQAVGRVPGARRACADSG